MEDFNERCQNVRVTCAKEMSILRDGKDASIKQLQEAVVLLEKSNVKLQGDLNAERVERIAQVISMHSASPHHTSDMMPACACCSRVDCFSLVTGEDQ